MVNFSEDALTSQFQQTLTGEKISIKIVPQRCAAEHQCLCSASVFNSLFHVSYLKYNLNEFILYCSIVWKSERGRVRRAFSDVLRCSQTLAVVMIRSQ